MFDYKGQYMTINIYDEFMMNLWCTYDEFMTNWRIYEEIMMSSNVPRTHTPWWMQSNGDYMLLDLLSIWAIGENFVKL